MWVASGNNNARIRDTIELYEYEWPRDDKRRLSCVMRFCDSRCRINDCKPIKIDGGGYIKRI